MMNASWEQGDLDLDGINIHYYRTGAGQQKKSLILCHGFSDNGLCWYRFAGALEADFDVVMVDARNHGKSDRADADIADMANDIAGVAASLQLTQPILLGHSMGASAVAECAALHPKLAGKIILEDPPWTKHRGAERAGDAEKREAGFRQYLTSLTDLSHAEVVKFGAKTYPGWHEDDLPDWADSKLQVSPAAMDGLSLGRWPETVAKLQCPAMLIYADGKGDGIVTHDIANEIVDTNNCFTVQHIADAGHNTRREQFEPYLAAVRAFLSE